MVKGKIVVKGNYARERIRNPSELKKEGYTRFRTKNAPGGHKLIIAGKGPESAHDTKLQAILHPLHEIPHGTKSMEKLK